MKVSMGRQRAGITTVSAHSGSTLGGPGRSTPDSKVTKASSSTPFLPIQAQMCYRQARHVKYPAYPDAREPYPPVRACVRPTEGRKACLSFAGGEKIVRREEDDQVD